MYPDRFPLSYLVTVGPKSIRVGQYEIFDPYLSSHIGTVNLENIRVNGIPATDAEKLIRCVSFDDVNGDGMSSAAGTVGEILFS